MVIVGLTGGFGTGKSFVAGLFRKLGSKVVDADKLAHGTLKKGSVTYKQIIAAFVRSILNKDGSINRPALGRLVFNDKKKLSTLNRIIHPVVIGQIKNKIKESGANILVIDAPLICETSLLKMIDMLVVVKSSRQKQIERCIKKFNLDKVGVYKRIACQMPLKMKLRKADRIIDNNGTRKGTGKQVIRIWQELKKGAIVWK